MQYKKPQPVFILSFLFLVAAVAVGYYLFLPKYNKFNEQKSEIVRLNNSIELKNSYENKINEIAQKLKEIDWEGKKEKIEINFDSSPFFLPKTEIFFRDMVSGSGMIFASINFSSASSIKGGAQQSQQETSDSTKGNTKEFKPQETPQAQSQTNSTFSGIRGPVNKVPFTLVVSGSYQSFKNLLESFEKQAFLISVKTITLSAPGVDGSISFSVVGEVYSY